MTSGSSATKPTRGQVHCECTQCGPGSIPITRATEKLHLDRDAERKLKKNAPISGPAISAAVFMANKRRNKNEPPLVSPPNTSANLPEHPPAPPEESVRDSDVNMIDASVAPPAHANAASASTPLSSAPPQSISETPLEPRRSLAEESPFWFWQLILITTAWLHLHYHTPHLACGLLLKVLRNIFLCLGLVKTEDKIPITLTTTFKRLGLNEHFEIRAICPQCRRAYPEDSPADLLCTHCHVPLFNTPPAPTSVPVSLLASTRTKTPPKACPVIQSPYLLPSTQLVEFLNREGNELDCESYLTRTRVPGKMQDIQDGDICQSLKGPDGRKFFETGPDRPDPEELRIGLCFGEDGFGFTRTNNAGTHTSGAASFCVTALPHHRRYRPRNLLLTSIGPGPHEETADEIQRSLAATVTDLLKLYDDGIFVRTPKYPNGRRVRVILVAVCCDHPAMCKVGGFSDHRSSNFPCTRCHITHDDIQTPAGVKVDAFPARDGDQHKRESAEYAKIPEDDKKARDAFASAHGTRYFEFSRIPYFDPVRQIIIDPMHCIFLGIVKTQWLDAWIKDPPALRKRTEKNAREIDQLHEYLKALEMPPWVARLPNQVGYPAGGNLTADEWKGMLLVFLPLILPHIWEEWYPVAKSDRDKAKAAWKKKETARLHRISEGTDSATDRKGPSKKPKPIRMLKNDPDLLLKLSACCKIILAGTIDTQALPRAQKLLEDYLAGFLKNHPTLVKPNFHYITHIFSVIRDFGPVYGFWTFLFERLNKLLKSYDTNNHADGELEVTFFREFHRDANLREALQKLGKKDGLTTEEQCMAASARMILRTDGDMRGTVASLTREIEELSEDLGIRFSMGMAVSKELPLGLQRDILEYYNTTYPTIPIVSRAADIANSPQSIFLHGSVQVHSHFILDGRRITSSSSQTGASSSLVQLDAGGVRYVGEVYNILTHRQPGLDRPNVLLDVRWMRRCVDFDTSVWDPYPELEIFVWEHGQFLRRHDLGPRRIVPITSIISQAARLTVEQKVQVPVSDSEEEEDDDSDVEKEAETSNGPTRKIWFTAGLTRDVVVV